MHNASRRHKPCSRLLKLDDERCALALAIADSLSSGVKANFGTPTKPLHVGTASRNGLMAALLARGGLSANPNAFEQEQGFFDVFDITTALAATELVLAELGADIERGVAVTAALKAYEHTTVAHSSRRASAALPPTLPAA